MATRLEVETRPAEPADLAAVLEIERESFSDPWSTAAFRSAVTAPHVYFLVAIGREPQRLLGYLVAWFAADEGEIANIAVAPAARQLGVGRRLLDAAVRQARERGVATMFLEVRESNVAARTLYESRGFAPVGRRRHYYQKPSEDALVMRANLGGGPDDDDMGDGEPSLVDAPS